MLRGGFAGSGHSTVPQQDFGKVGKTQEVAPLSGARQPSGHGQDCQILGSSDVPVLEHVDQVAEAAVLPDVYWRGA